MVTLTFFPVELNCSPSQSRDTLGLTSAFFSHSATVYRAHCAYAGDAVHAARLHSAVQSRPGQTTERLTRSLDSIASMDSLNDRR